MRVNVKELIGEHALTFEDGEVIYNLIHPELSKGKPVVLEFDGVEIFSSPFFNSGIGRLLKDISSDDLNRLLEIKNITPAGRMVLRQVIENSKQYYLLDASTRNDYDEILTGDIENI